MRDSTGPLQRGVHFGIHHQIQQRSCSKRIIISRITSRCQYRKRSNQMCVKAKSVSKSVPVVTLPRLLSSYAREILGYSCLYCRHHFRPKTISPSKNKCDPDFSLNRTGPDRYYALRLRTNIDRLVIIKKHNSIQLFFSELGGTCTTRRSFLGPIQGGYALELCSTSLSPTDAQINMAN